MPDYDYDEFARRYEEGREESISATKTVEDKAVDTTTESPADPTPPNPPTSDADLEDEMSW